MTRPVAMITGASRGIGAESAVALAREGFDVAITARTLEAGEAYDHAGTVGAYPGSLAATAKQIEALGGRALCLQADILDEARSIGAVQQVLKEFGQLDLLLNNATFQGIGNMVPLADLERGHLEATFQSNVFTPLAMIREALPAMQARGTGTVINMLSATAYSDPPAPPDAGGWGFAYAAAKAAMGRLAGCLRAEYPEAGLRFFNLEPGTVITELMKRAGMADAILKYADPCSAAAIAGVVAWLSRNEPEAGWLADGALHAPVIAKALFLLDAPSLLEDVDG